MAKEYDESIGDHMLDEPDYNRFEEEPDPDAPRGTDELNDLLWIIGTGKTLKEWGKK